MGLRQYWRTRGDRRAQRRAPPAQGFGLLPEPLTTGLFARGRQIAAGSLLLAGRQLESRDPFGTSAPSPEFAAELHGFAWLDHLAAFGDGAAREVARRWTNDWILRHGAGKTLGTGPGWTPELTGRRVLHWLHHGLFLTAGAEPETTARYFAVLGAQTAYLARSHARAAPGLPRIEAVSGWFHAALMLRGMEAHATPALTALTRTAETTIGSDGGIDSRNPEELLLILQQLGWSAALLARTGKPLPEPLGAAMLRGARALKALRHADGGLARFHGGGAGPEGVLERTLALAAPGDRRRPIRAMGFARLEGGRTTVIADAAPPPGGAAAGRAQASTLGFELTSGRRPVIVSCGPGRDFGADWDTAARATLSHSTLSLDGVSSARFATMRRAGTTAALIDGPRDVTLHRSDERHASALILSHDGWVVSHGLTHTRHLDLSADGRALLGEDALTALYPDHRRKLEQILNAEGGRGLGYTLRFHLHPDTDPSLDMNGRAVSVALQSGEVWVFRFDGPARLSLEPSVWLEPGRRAPRPCRQIVLRATLTQAAVQINWTLAKAQDTPLAIRDIGRDSDLALPPDFFDRD
jgi:uncharacterized heparinase superfamily protein